MDQISLLVQLEAYIPEIFVRRPYFLLLWLRIFVFFPCLSNRMSEWNLK
jgi:hypothetical protein